MSAIDEYSKILMYVCMMARIASGYSQDLEFQESDCDYLACKENCPIAKQPKLYNKKEEEN